MYTNQDIYFAAVGDVHGHIYTMLGLLQSWEKRHGLSLSFVLQVGDFEAHRSSEDLLTMDAPTKYKKLGDFSDFYTGKAKFPYPIWFIGGNHESYGFLDRFPQGQEIAPNFNYIGRVNLLELAGLRIVGVSGIYKQQLFQLSERPSASEIKYRSNKEYISFLESEIERAIDYRNADILLLHDWASGIISPEDLAMFQSRYSNARYESIGNEYARLLVEALCPKLVLCGHMHLKYRSTLSFSSEIASQICCLANVQQGRDSLAVFRLTSEFKIIEITN
ncbi:MAG: metallophosphoesterase [Cyanobacteria bacterium P01_A01_bin.83]